MMKPSFHVELLVSKLLYKAYFKNKNWSYVGIQKAYQLRIPVNICFTIYVRYQNDNR